MITPLLFTAAALVMFSLFVIFPIIQSMSLLFYEWQGIAPKKWVGFNNYELLVKHPVLWKTLVNDICWLVLFLFAPVFGLLTVLFPNQKVLGIRLVKSLSLFPSVVSQIVMGLVFTWYYDPALGLIAALIEPLGLKLPSVLASED